MQRFLALVLFTVVTAAPAHATVFGFVDPGTYNVRDAGGAVVAMVSVHVDGGGLHEHVFMTPSYAAPSECNDDVDFTFEYLGAAMGHNYRPAAVGSTWTHALSVVSNPSLPPTASVPPPEECDP